MYKVSDLPESFRTKIQVSTDGCWEWVAALFEGYGRYHNQGKMILAHRFSYEFYLGPILPKMEIHHKCRCRSCVNPDHLQAVSSYENKLLDDIYHKGGQASGQKRKAITHCPKGHPYDAVNTYTDDKGKRVCRSCRKEQDRLRRLTCPHCGSPMDRDAKVCRSCYMKGVQPNAI